MRQITESDLVKVSGGGKDANQRKNDVLSGGGFGASVGGAIGGAAGPAGAAIGAVLGALAGGGLLRVLIALLVKSK